MAVRFSIADFSLANAIYAGATITFYTVSGGAATTTKATLYQGATGTATLPNPQRLDGTGKFRQPVYSEVAVIATVSGLSIPSHSTGIIGNADSAAAVSAAAAIAAQGAAEAAQQAAEDAQAAAELAAGSIDLPTAVASTILIRDAGNSAYVPTDAADTRAFLGLGTMATQDKTAVDIEGGTITFGVSEVTIASGSITPTGQNHTVDTESDSASDDLTTVVLDNIPDEGLVTFRAAHTDRTVVVKNAADNLFTATGLDYRLDDAVKSITFQRRGSNLYEVSQSSRVTGLVQRGYDEDVDYAAITTTIPEDDSIPQNDEGVEILSVTLPAATIAGNRVRARGVVTGGVGAATTRIQAAMFRSGVANAIAVAAQTGESTNATHVLGIEAEFEAVAESVTITLRVGSSATFYKNGTNGVRQFGGAQRCTLVVEEITA